MHSSNENISQQIVEVNTESILERLAPEFQIDPLKIPEIAGLIVNGLLQYKAIDKSAVTEVIKEVVPGTAQLLSNLADKFYDCLLSCPEEERPDVLKTFIVVAGVTIGVGILCCVIGSVTKVGMIQHGKTLRTNIRCSALKNILRW